MDKYNTLEDWQEELAEDVATVEHFADEIKNLAKYIRTNPEDKSLDQMRDLVLKFLPMNLDFMTQMKNYDKNVFRYMVKGELKK